LNIYSENHEYLGFLVSFLLCGLNP
jgi:hypothetical protein